MRNGTGLLAIAGLALGLMFGVAMRPQPTAATPADTTQAAAGKVAICDTYAVMERMLASDRYSPARDTLQAGKRTSLEALQTEINEIQTKGQAMKQDDPELPKLSEQFQAKRAQFQSELQAAQGELDTLTTTQIAEAYRLVVEATNKVAEAGGYSTVLSTRRGTEIPTAGGADNAFREITLRTVLRNGAADDLTDRVIAELKLQDVVVKPTVAPGEAKPEAPTAPAAPVAAPEGEKK